MRQVGGQPPPPPVGDVAGGNSRSRAAPPEGEGLPSGHAALGSSRDSPALRVVGSEAARQTYFGKASTGSGPNGQPGVGDNTDPPPDTEEEDVDSSDDEEATGNEKARSGSSAAPTPSEWCTETWNGLVRRESDQKFTSAYARRSTRRWGGSSGSSTFAPPNQDPCLLAAFTKYQKNQKDLADFVGYSTASAGAIGHAVLQSQAAAEEAMGILKKWAKDDPQWTQFYETWEERVIKPVKDAAAIAAAQFRKCVDTTRSHVAKNAHIALQPILKTIVPTPEFFFGNQAKTLTVAMQSALMEQQMAQATSAPRPPQRHYQRQPTETSASSSSGSSYARSRSRGGGYASKSKGKYPSRGGGGKKKPS